MHIVELYGLPGCGKTTLRDMLIKETTIEKYRSIITVGEEYKRQGVMTKIAHLPVSEWCTLINLFSALPFLPLREWYKYRHLFVVTLLYSYANRVEANAYMIIDHGIVQDVVGILYGNSDNISPRALRHLCVLVEKLQLINVCYCEIGVDIALQRIRKRNRQGEGRLDAIADDNVLIKKLSVLESMFTKIHKALLSAESVTNSKVDMTKEPSQIKESILQRVNMKYA